MRLLAIGMNLLIVVLLLGSCTPGARQQAVTSAFVTLNAARDGFLAYDLKHQEEIVDKATTREAARTNIDNYRKRRELVIRLFESAYQSLAAAAVLNKDPSALANMMVAGARLQEALKTFMAGGEP